MLYIENNSNCTINENLLNKICNTLTQKDVELLIVDDRYMKELNLSQRGKDESTDVLSFPLEEIEHSPLGSIVINIQKAEEISSKLGHSTENEIALLFIHGLLHLLGYDHEKDNGEMRQKEEKIIKEFNLPTSLIVRVS